MDTLQAAAAAGTAGASPRTALLHNHSTPITTPTSPSRPRVGSSTRPSKAELGFCLAAARERVESALDGGWWTFIGWRRQLEEALEKLGEAERELALLRRAPVFTEGRASASNAVTRTNTLPYPLRGLLEEEDAGPTRSLTRKWLLQTFTVTDLEVAGGLEAGGNDSSSASYDSNGSEEEEDADGTPCRPLPRMKRSSTEINTELNATLQDQEVEQVLRNFGQFDFDAVAFAGLFALQAAALEVVAAEVLQRGSVIRKLCDQGLVLGEAKVFQTRLYRFLGEVGELYQADIPYHGVAHAVDVLATMEWFLRVPYLQEEVSTLDRLMVLVASLIHDVGHPGKNNLFLVKTMAPAAMTYNDKSVLENMHLALSFQTLHKDLDVNWFVLLARAFHRRSDREDGGDEEEEDHAQIQSQAPAVNLQHYMRRGLIELVLATDMARHAEHVEHIQSFVKARQAKAASAGAAGAAGAARAQPKSKHEALERRLLLLETTLHAADISNPCKPKSIMLGWTRRILAEFWAQGDEERQLGLEVSPMCDRQSGRETIPKGQLGFIQFVVQPLFRPIVELMPEAAEAASQLAENALFWEEMGAAEAMPEQIFGTD